MPVPRRLTEQSGRYALVDWIPFSLPVRARDLLPGNAEIKGRF
jgi:hypothetical protein